MYLIKSNPQSFSSPLVFVFRSTRLAKKTLFTRIRITYQHRKALKSHRRRNDINEDDYVRIWLKKREKYFEPIGDLILWVSIRSWVSFCFCFRHSCGLGRKNCLIFHRGLYKALCALTFQGQRSEKIICFDIFKRKSLTWASRRKLFSFSR